MPVRPRPAPNGYSSTRLRHRGFHLDAAALVVQVARVALEQRLKPLRDRVAAEHRRDRQAADDQADAQDAETRRRVSSGSG